MNVTLDQAELIGAISSATLVPVIGDGNISFDNIRDVGVIQETTLEYNTFARLNISLENGARWVVTEPSYLMSLTLDDSSTLEAAPGYRLVMTVYGKETPIESGTYTGEIQLDLVADESAVPGEPEAPESSAVETAPEAPTPNPEPAPAPTEEPAPEVSEAPAEAASGLSGGAIAGIVIVVVIVLGVVAVLVVKKKK